MVQARRECIYVVQQDATTLGYIYIYAIKTVGVVGENLVFMHRGIVS
jgi:hypothetical protein